MQNQFFYNNEQARESGFQIASLAGCEEHLTAEDYENCLVGSSLTDIVAAGTSPLRVKQGYPRANKDDFSMHGSIFPDYPENIIDFGLHNKVPVMAGTNTAEGAPFAGDVFWDPELMERLNDEDVWKAEGPCRVLFRTPGLARGDWEPCNVFMVEGAKQFISMGHLQLQNYRMMLI